MLQAACRLRLNRICLLISVVYRRRALLSIVSVLVADLQREQPFEDKITIPMIVRETNSDFLLITQPDHAELAEDIVRAMTTEPSLLGAARETILLATREHDNGWTEVDAFPTIDPA